MFENEEIDGFCIERNWFDCDTNKDDCGRCDNGQWNLIGSSDFPNCNGQECWIAAGEITGEYNSKGAIGCCGDDSNEYFITTNGRGACCNNPHDLVDENGNCISQDLSLFKRAVDAGPISFFEGNPLCCGDDSGEHMVNDKCVGGTVNDNSRHWMCKTPLVPCDSWERLCERLGFTWIRDYCTDVADPDIKCTVQQSLS